MPRQEIGPQVSFRAPQELFEFINSRAENEQRSISWVMRDILSEYVKAKKTKGIEP